MNRSNARAPLTRPRTGWCSSGSPANDLISASGPPAIRPAKYGTGASRSRRVSSIRASAEAEKQLRDPRHGPESATRPHRGWRCCLTLNPRPCSARAPPGSVPSTGPKQDARVQRVLHCSSPLARPSADGGRRGVLRSCWRRVATGPVCWLATCPGRLRSRRALAPE
jgi:hypothetical protein